MPARPLLDALRSRYTAVLAVTTIAVYGLVITGATASLVEAGAACSTWPTCEGVTSIPLDDTSLAVAVVHRISSLLVGLLLIGVVATAWFIDAPRSVLAALGIALVLYPMQVGLGAMTALGLGGELVTTVHLVVAMAIFTSVLVGLVFWLEFATRDVTSSFGSTAEPTAVNPPPRPTGSTSVGWATTVGAYVQLTKPRLMWLLCIVALAGMGLATATTGIELTTTMVVGTLLGGVLAIGSSGTFNHVLEHDIDERMQRTADRPIVNDIVPKGHALLFGITLGLASLVVFITMVNVMAAALGLLAIVFYSVVYTLVLKPHTTQNIVIGGAVGALPALIGWAAVTETIGLPALLLGLIIFLWTPAHFYNLALVYKEDYARGGFPMLPVVKGETITRRHIVYYLGATLLAVSALGAVATLGWLYVMTAIVFAGLFLAAIVHLYRQQTPTAALRTFHTSNVFLGVLMLVIVLETIVF